jgi:hypothetical protein
MQHFLLSYDELQKAGIPVRAIDLFSVPPTDQEELVAPPTPLAARW